MALCWIKKNNSPYINISLLDSSYPQLKGPYTTTVLKEYCKTLIRKLKQRKFESNENLKEYREFQQMLTCRLFRKVI